MDFPFLQNLQRSATFPSSITVNSGPAGATIIRTTGSFRKRLQTFDRKKLTDRIRPIRLLPLYSGLSLGKALNLGPLVNIGPAQQTFSSFALS